MTPIPAFDLLYFYGQVLASQPDRPSPSSEHSFWIIYVGISLTCLTTRFGPETCKRRAPSVVKLHCMCSTQYSAWSPTEKPQPQTCKRVCVGRVWGGRREALHGLPRVLAQPPLFHYRTIRPFGCAGQGGPGVPQFNHNSIGLGRNGVRAKDRVLSELMVQQEKDRMATKLL